MTQLELGHAYARVKDPETSHAAAKSVEGKIAAEAEARVLQALRVHEQVTGDGLTTHEIAFAADMEYGTVTPRMKPLVRKGLVVNSGQKRIPLGRSKQGIVWKSTTKGNQ